MISCARLGARSSRRHRYAGGGELAYNEAIVQPPLGTPMVYQFGAFELDEHCFELRRAGAALDLEPRVLELLLYLLRHRDRVVPKSELIDRVWQASVSDAALTHCVMELRKAIADGCSEDPIKTLHRRGYRFVAPVHEQVDQNEEPAAAAPVEEQRQNREWITPSFQLGISVAAAVAVIVVGVIALRNVPPVPRLAILPISTSASDGELNILAMSMGDFLSTRLEQVPSLVVRSPEMTAALSVESQSLSEFARAAGVSYVISGNIRRTSEPGRARVDLRLHHFSDGRVEETPLGQYDVPLVHASPDVRQFREVRENVTRTVLNQLLPALELKPDAGLAPANAQAYRLYLIAHDRLSQGACDGDASIELLKRSLELDPKFAPAWETYALAEYGLASSCGEDARHYQNALDALARANHLAPGSPHVIALAATIRVEMGLAETAYDVVRSAPRDVATTADVHFAAAYVLWYAGFLKESRKHLEAALAVDPSFLAVGGWTPNVYLYQRDIAHFTRSLPTSDAPLFRYYRGFTEFQGGDRRAARQTLGPAFRSNPSDVFGRLANALLDVVEDRRGDAGAILRELERQRREVRSSDGEFTYKIAEIYQLAGQSTPALAELRQSVDQGFFCVPCIEHDPIWNPIRTRPEYRAAVSRAEARRNAFGARFGLSE